MKFMIQIVDPERISNSIHEAARQGLKEMALEDDERDAVEKKRLEKLDLLCERWIADGEYMLIEIDTEAKTATVLPVR